MLKVLRMIVSEWSALRCAGQSMLREGLDRGLSRPAPAPGAEAQRTPPFFWCRSCSAPTGCDNKSGVRSRKSFHFTVENRSQSELDVVVRAAECVRWISSR